MALRQIKGFSRSLNKEYDNRKRFSPNFMNPPSISFQTSPRMKIKNNFLFFQKINKISILKVASINTLLPILQVRILRTKFGEENKIIRKISDHCSLKVIYFIFQMEEKIRLRFFVFWPRGNAKNFLFSIIYLNIQQYVALL